MFNDNEKDDPLIKFYFDNYSLKELNKQFYTLMSYLKYNNNISDIRGILVLAAHISAAIGYKIQLQTGNLNSGAFNIRRASSLLRMALNNTFLTKLAENRQLSA